MLATSTIVVACGGGDPSPAQQPFQRTKVLTEHRAQKASFPTKAFGEDCSQFGASECRSKVCLHAQLNPSGGYRCSSECKGAAGCPAGWQCAAIPGAAAASVCVLAQKVKLEVKK